MLAPPAAQRCSLHQGPRLLFPNHRQSGTPGDLTSFLSKNNGQASSSTEGKGWEEDAGQRQLMEKESYQAYVLTPPEPKVTSWGVPAWPWCPRGQHLSVSQGRRTSPLQC